MPSSSLLLPWLDLRTCAVPCCQVCIAGRQTGAVGSRQRLERLDCQRVRARYSGAGKNQHWDQGNRTLPSQKQQERPGPQSGEIRARTCASFPWCSSSAYPKLPRTACSAPLRLILALASLKLTAPCLSPSFLCQVRVIIGGVQIRPGDWVYADADGVLVSKEELSV